MLFVPKSNPKILFIFKLVIVVYMRKKNKFVLQSKANHNKDYSVVKTFKAAFMQMGVAFVFSILLSRFMD
jgi:hypothetical protein